MQRAALFEAAIFAFLLIGIHALLQEGASAGELIFNPLGPEVRINQYSGYSQDDSWAAMDDEARSVVVWTSLGDIYARLFGAGGAPRTAEFRVNETTTGTQNFPKVAFRPDGKSFVVVAVPRVLVP